MKKIIFFFLLAGFTGALFTSCQKNGPEVDYQAPELNLPATEYSYSNEEFPDHFSQISSFDNEPIDNQVTDAGATLGRVLFYDTKLSLNNTVSCGTCHIQSLAFSDGKKFSPGFEGNLSTRNTLSIVNPRFAATLTHCGGSVCALGLSELGQMDRGWKGGRSSPGCCRLHNRGLLPDRVPELLCCSRSEVSFNPRNGSGSSCKFASGTMLSCGSAKLCHLLLE